MILIALFVYIIAGRDIYTVPDTLVYVDNYIFTDTNAEWSSILSGPYGFGWNLFNLLCRKAGFGYRVFLGLIALLPCLLYFYAVNLLRENTYLGGGLCVKFSLWVSFWGMVWTGITLRVGMALPFAFLSHIFMLRQNYIKAAFSFFIAYTFHSSIVVYPVFLFLSGMIKMKHKSYYIYGGLIIILWLMNISMNLIEITHVIMARVLNMITANLSFLSGYSVYVGDVYNSFTSRKNFMFIVIMFCFVAARPKKNPQYDHWLKFFAFNLAMTFPLSTFIIGYRVSDICLISALPLMLQCVTSKKFSLELRICICLTFIISMFIFSLRMTGVY